MVVHALAWVIVGAFACLLEKTSMKFEYIDRIETENTGGGSMVDFVILKDGRVLGINDEYVCLYKSLEDFWDATSENKPTIEL